MPTEREPMPTDRNVEICRRYSEEGWTLHQCAAHYGIGRERVRQILLKAGLYQPPPRGRRPGVPRDEFLGINISPEDKDALRAEAARRGLSMSALTSDLIKDMLAGLAR